MASYVVTVEKVNSGVSLYVAPRRKMRPLTLRRIILQAWERYAAEVCERLNAEGYHGSAMRVAGADPETYTETAMGHVDLEPWGFARRSDDGAPTMDDSGSAPTGLRANLLLCYQAPLTAQPDGRLTRTYQVEV